MRLIDADLLVKNCKCTGKFEDNFKCVSLAELKKVIENQPTAFDVDEVVEQLQKISDEAEDEISVCEKEDCLYFDGFSDGVDKAIEIVKGGVKYGEDI